MFDIVHCMRYIDTPQTMDSAQRYVPVISLV